MLNKIIDYFLRNKLVTTLFLVGLIIWGIATAPFAWNVPVIPSDPVPVDAIPDIGENQQIVFTKWPGRSPQDIEDQISYPLTTYLLGIPGVKTIRSNSMFGFSSIYIIFEEDVEFYWSRSRILEKLNSMPNGLLPSGITPSLGPDATALGQVYWYTLEGRDTSGQVTGGWGLDELRSVQDFYVKYALSAVDGVSEVASIGGFVKEYQVDVDPDALQSYDITLTDVVNAVRNSNIDVGAQTIEVNKVEYMVRGLGYIESLEDLELAVVAETDNTPIYLKDVAHVTHGPATRRGILDKGGAEVVGGVVIARYGANPMHVINGIKEKVEAISSGLPSKELIDGNMSQLSVVPFYDRSELIDETLGTLEEALSLEILITILVVLLMVYHLRASMLISLLLPIAVLFTFIAMSRFGVDANIVALSGIAIAIGTMVDLGIILTENVLVHVNEGSEKPLIDRISKGVSEVSGAIVTAVSTTVVSFIPVFAMENAEGKLFGPLAYTKTFALISALLVSLFFLPMLAHLFLSRVKSKAMALTLTILTILAGIILLSVGHNLVGLGLVLMGVIDVLKSRMKQEPSFNRYLQYGWDHSTILIAVVIVTWILSNYWMPLGPMVGEVVNFIFVSVLVGLVLTVFSLLRWKYEVILNWCLDHKWTFLSIPAFFILLALNIWLGFSSVFGFIPRVLETMDVNVKQTKVWSALAHTFPGIGQEFMPSLDEGAFLLMPTSMPHSGVEYNREIVGQLDMRIAAIPEINQVVGKAGRVESAIDPAPISMFENIITYKSEYATDSDGHRIRFRTEGNRFVLVDSTSIRIDSAAYRGLDPSVLLPDEDGQFYRQWRSEIQSPDDIWNEIVEASRIPGVTSSPKLQPIETRLVMLQTGMRAPMGIKIYGDDLEVMESFGQALEVQLKKVPGVKAEAVFADRIVGKPYLEIDIDRVAIAQYGLTVKAVQDVIEIAIGGIPLNSSVEGRERYNIRVRYPRERRDSPESIGDILVPTPSGAQIPLAQLAHLEYVKGPQSIKSEDTFLVGYVLFDKSDGYSEVEVVNNAQTFLKDRIESGELSVPQGVRYEFSGSYENQVRAQKRLSFIVPMVLVLVFLILYFQFKSASTSAMVFSGIALAFSGAFVVLWLFGQSWFMNFDIMGQSFRSIFGIQTINLSVAVWVGFIALFGIATDDGVLMATYLDDSFKLNKPKSRDEVRQTVIEGGLKRIRPAVMTSATTVIALLPILSSSGRGADVMIPMAIPAVGGMLMASITFFIVPVLYAMREERRIRKNAKS
ncbi:efflux RND transporter permease subunit [Phaeocystidibacter marisrubri]|uniref:Efflux RND transporter permease subunit n=1 Tax=Phaeocystidibacter marisrubri TaxID=1577780 RepID=A0A6L3ZGN4_9FLAO|nr:efflux RND transporter permease subunit [Phaeocystidibacter marisrubri]KAB2816577.1 efflux RND transporter permease subunit [Phaeocystidibacter marisrubri]GGH69756.1 cation transporter [Phaeocystidibacter marisrubri]